MGTESHIRFASKVRRYLAYKDSRMFRVRFGGRSFRVLIVAPTIARLRSLKRLTESQAGQRVFWFALLGGIASERIVEPVRQLAGEETRAELFRHCNASDRDRP